MQSSSVSLPNVGVSTSITHSPSSLPRSLLHIRLFLSPITVAQPDQARIVGLNAHHFLKNGGHVLISIKASCIDSTAPAEAVFAAEVAKMQTEMIKPNEQLTLEPYERDHVSGLITEFLIGILEVGPDGKGAD